MTAFTSMSTLRVRQTARSVALAASCLLIACSASAQSQASTGLVAGRVTDTSGGVLRGVVVEIIDAAKGLRHEVTTNDEGLYVFALVPVGTYELQMQLDGFQEAKVHDVPVTVGTSLKVDVVLTLGSSSEAVTVTATAVNADPAVSTLFDARFVAALPINGRRFQDWFVLTPHAQVDIQRGQLSLTGQRGVYSNVIVDGVDYNEPFFGGLRGGSRSNFAPTIPQEAIREFRVTAAGAAPEFGRSAGIVTVVTKSGTNQTTGTGFYVNRHRDLASPNAFGERAAPSLQQWGGAMGGPITRDRMFYFAALEWQDASYPRRVTFDALQGTTPTRATSEAFNYFKSLEGPFTETNDAIAALVRVDRQLSNASWIDVRYSGSRNIGLNAISPGNASFPVITAALSHNGTEHDQIHSLVGQFRHAGASNRLFEGRAQYSVEHRPRDTNAIMTRVIAPAIGRFGTASFLGQNEFVDWRGQAAGNVTQIARRHTVKAGLETNYVSVDQVVGLNQTGGFTVNGDATTALELMSGAIQNRFDSTAVSYVRQIGNLQQSMASTEMAAFAQDAWRLAPNLTVSYGLRWEGMFNPSPEATNQDLVRQLAGFVFPSGRTVDPTTIPDALNQWAPRAGIAWSPGMNDHILVRGHAGVHYARTPGIILAAPLTGFRQPPGDLSVQLPFIVPGSPYKTVYQQFSLIGIDLNQWPLDKLPILSIDQTLQIAKAMGVSEYGGAQPIVVDPQFRNPRTDDWGAGIERRLGRSFVAVDYVELRTSQLARNLDLNLPSPVIRPDDPAARPFYGLRSGNTRPLSSLSQVIVRESTARSLYRALSVNSRLRNDWGEVNVSYVFGRSRSDDDNEADIGGMVAADAYNLAPEYSDARLDRRHQLTGAWSLFLPKNFEAAGSFEWRSGIPVDVNVAAGSDLNEDRSSGADRPYHSPGVPFERNLFRNRSIATVDVRVVKTFRTARAGRWSLFVDVFNLLNASNLQYSGSDVTNYCSKAAATCGFDGPTNPNFLQLVDRNPDSARFGQYLLSNTPGDPRQIQIGIRTSF